MSVLKGCREGKSTPKLTEVCCPQCGNLMEIFVRLGGDPDETGRVISDETCGSCGHVIVEGTLASQLKQG